MKLHRKIKHVKKLCHAQNLRSHATDQGHNRSKVKSRLKSCFSHNLKTTEVNLMKLKRDIKQNEKVCCIQDLTCQGQGHCQGFKVSAITLKLPK